MNPRGLTGFIVAVAVATILAGVVSAEPELLMVTEMYRHGHRGPLGTFVKDGWLSFSELTEVGLRQHYIAGVELRRRYKDFLPQNYSYLNVYTRSTNYNRTLMSAMAHSLGLFPMGSGPRLPDNYPVERAVPPIKISITDLKALGQESIPNGFQPVPILTQDDEDDLSTAGYAVCPYITNHRYKEYTKTDKWKEINGLFEKYMPDIAKTYNMEKLTVAESQLIFDSLMSNYFQGNVTPITFNTTMWHTLSEIWDLAVMYSVYPDRQAVKLAAWPFLQELFTIMDKKLNGTTPDMKWYAYSVHDINLMNILLAFNLTSVDCLLAHAKNETAPNSTEKCLESSTFASLLLFELYKDEKTGETFIQMQYNDNNYSLCGGPTLCPYEAVKTKVFNEFKVDDWKVACGIVPPNGPTAEVKSYAWFVPLLIVFSLIIIVLMVSLLRMRRKLYEMTLSSIDDGQYIEVK